MIRELVTDIEKLSERAKEFEVLIDQDKTSELVQDICDTLNSLEDRLYLTANQIGFEERAVGIKLGEETDVLMNPALVKRDKLIINREKDLLTGKEYFIPRYNEVEVNFQDSLGKIRALKMTDIVAITMCQAIDALNGLLVTDYGLEVLPEFDEASEEEKAEVLEAYMSSLAKASEDMDKELSKDEETSKIWKNAKFIKGVQDGTITPVKEEKQLSNRKKKKLNKLVKWIKSQKSRRHY